MTAYPPAEAPGGGGGGSSSGDDAAGANANPRTANAIDLPDDQDKPVETYIESYTKTFNVPYIIQDNSVDIFGNTSDQTYVAANHDIENWSNGNGGTGTFSRFWDATGHTGSTPFHYSGEYVDHRFFPPSFWPDVETGTQSDTNNDPWPPDVSPEITAVNIPFSWESISVDLETAILTHTLWTSHYNRNVAVVYILKTGGRANSTRQNLFRLNASAQKKTSYQTGNYVPSPGFHTEDVPFQNIRLLQKQVGSDGNLWIMLPDNVTRIITPEVPGTDYYTFGVGQQKYTLKISANYTPLDPDMVVNGATNWWVGQKIEFAPVWLPTTPSFMDAVAHWTLPGSYVNTNPYSYCPTFYNKNGAFLNKILSLDGTLSTYCWYVYKLQEGTAQVSMDL